MQGDHLIILGDTQIVLLHFCPIALAMVYNLFYFRRYLNSVFKGSESSFTLKFKNGVNIYGTFSRDSVSKTICNMERFRYLSPQQSKLEKENLCSPDLVMFQFSFLSVTN